MNVSGINDTNFTFGARFVNNKAFKEVVDYAAHDGRLGELDGALHKIAKANPGEILIMHGQKGDSVYSNFSFSNKHTVCNSALGAESPSEASLNGILELGALGAKFKKLLGIPKVETSVTPEEIIREYTIS